VTSAWAVTAVFDWCLPVFMALRFLSNNFIRGFKHNTYSIMLRGYPWRTELLIGI